MQEKFDVKNKKSRSNKYINTDPTMDNNVAENKSISEIVKEFFSNNAKKLEEASMIRKRHHYLFSKSGKVMTDARFKLYRRKNEDIEYLNDLFNMIEEVEKRFQDDPSNREWGTDSLTAIYKKDTPGQHSDMQTEVAIRNADGKLKRIANVPIRMVSGEIKILPPGKSGSSGGGDGG